MKSLTKIKTKDVSNYLEVFFLKTATIKSYIFPYMKLCCKVKYEKHFKSKIVSNVVHKSCQQVVNSSRRFLSDTRRCFSTSIQTSLIYILRMSKM